MSPEFAGLLRAPRCCCLHCTTAASRLHIVELAHEVLCHSATESARNLATTTVARISLPFVEACWQYATAQCLVTADIP